MLKEPATVDEALAMEAEWRLGNGGEPLRLVCPRCGLTLTLLAPRRRETPNGSWRRPAPAHAAALLESTETGRYRPRGAGFADHLASAGCRLRSKLGEVTAIEAEAYIEAVFEREQQEHRDAHRLTMAGLVRPLLRAGLVDGVRGTESDDDDDALPDGRR